MKKLKLAIASAILFNSSLAIAGGLLTNTNQSVHFLRNPARDASTEIDAAYTNPAGLVKLKDGLHFSFTNQSAFQTRTITSDFKELDTPFGPVGGGNGKFKGTASAPIIPSLQGAYKKGKWVLSGNLAIVGGGGKATFNNGLPSFEALTAASMQTILLSQSYKANQYEVDQHMKGSNFIFGAQLGGTYKINDMFSAYAGFRLNIVSNKYEGYLRNLKLNLTPIASPQFSPNMASPQQVFEAIGSAAPVESKPLFNILSKASSEKGAQLDCSQSGWGVAPILGVNFSHGNLNIGAKYEFRTSLDIENDTKVDDTYMFGDGVNTAHDIPAMLTIGASYKILPALTASVGYHHFFDSDAGMDKEKEKFAGSTNEYLFGLEYQIDRMFMVSGGGQITRYGVKDDYQKDLSFACDSYSLGFGGAVNISPTVRINVGYFWTTYSDYKKEPGAGAIPQFPTAKDTFSRTNKVFGAGVDFRF